MSKVLLQPASNDNAFRHFQDTVKKPVLISDILPYVNSDSEKIKINQISKNGSVFVWGLTPGESDRNIKKWDKIDPGDVTLFYRKKFIIASAVTTYKFHNKELAKSLWGNDQYGETWEYIYIIDEIKNLKIGIEEFNEIVGYKANNIIQGFTILDENKSSKVLYSFGLTSDQYFEDVTEKEFVELSTADLSGPLDEKVLVNVRKEQSFLRKNLFEGKTEFKCGICDRLLPINLLVAAHIKKRSECKPEERRDYRNIVMPMCKIGCDDLFEKGYIGVINGKIIINKSLNLTSDLQEAIFKLNSKKCDSWSQGNSNYFQWHANRMGINIS